MLVHPCGCSYLNGRLASPCDRHLKSLASEGGRLAAVPELDAWLKRQEEGRSYEDSLTTEQLLTRRA